MDPNRTKTGKRHRVMLSEASKKRLHDWCKLSGFQHYVAEVTDNTIPTAQRHLIRRRQVNALIVSLTLMARTAGREAQPDETFRTVDERLNDYVRDTLRHLPLGTTYAKKNGIKTPLPVETQEAEQLTLDLGTKPVENPNFDSTTSTFIPTPVEPKPRPENPNAIHGADGLESRPVPEQILGIAKDIRKTQTQQNEKLSVLDKRIEALETKFTGIIAFLDLLTAAAKAFTETIK